MSDLIPFNIFNNNLFDLRKVIHQIKITVLLSTLAINVEVNAQDNPQEVIEFYTLEKFSMFENINFKWDMEGRIQAELNEGLNKIEDTNYRPAIANFENVIHLDSTLWIPYYYRAVCLKKIGEFEAAERDFKLIKKLNHNIFQVHLELGKTYYLKNELPAAKRSFQNALRINKISPVANYFLGEVMLKMPDIIRAKKYFTKAAKQNNSDAKLKLALFEVIEQRNIELAIPLLNEIIRLDSTHVETLILRGLLNLKENPSSSLIDFNKLVAGNPLNFHFLLWRALTLIETEDFHEAFFDLIKVFRANPQNEGSFIGKQTTLDKRIDLYSASEYIISNIYGLREVDSDHIKKAFCLFAIGKYKEGINSIHQLDDFRSSPLGLFLVGMANEHIGQHERAWTHYNLALKYDSTIVDAYKKTAIYNTNVGNWDEAEKRFTKALELNRNLNNIYKLRGVARFKLEDLDGAVDDFTKYLSIDSTDNDALASRASAYAKLNEHELALEDLLRVDGFIPHKYSDYSKSINSLLISGDTSKALNYLDKYTLKNSSTDAIIFKINLLIELESWDRATIEIENGLNEINPAGYISDQYSFLLYAKGVISVHKKNNKQAERLLTQALEIDRNNLRAYIARGQLYLSQGKKEYAKKDFENALRLGAKEAEQLLQQF